MTRRLQVQPGAYSVLPAGSEGEWVFTEPTDTMHLNFSTQVLESVLPAGKKGSLDLPWSVDDQDPQVNALLKTLAVEAAGGYQSGTLFGESLVSAIVARLTAKYGYAAESLVEYGLSKGQLRSLDIFIEENLHANLTIATLASVVGYSPWHFQRLFQSTTGQSVHRYVMNIRILRAKHLLRATELSATEIAFQCGFSNTSHLAKHFRLQLGCTPLQYRERL